MCQITSNSHGGRGRVDSAPRSRKEKDRSIPAQPQQTWQHLHSTDDPEHARESCHITLRWIRPNLIPLSGRASLLTRPLLTGH